MNEAKPPKVNEVFKNKILDRSISGIYVYDLVRGNNIYINKQYTNLTGYTLEDLNSMKESEFFGLFHPEDQAAIAKHMEEVIATKGEEIIEIEYRFKKADGQWIWCFSRDTVFYRDESGVATQFMGSFVDITKRKDSEKQLEASRKELAQLNETIEEKVEIRTSEFQQYSLGLEALMEVAHAPYTSLEEVFGAYLKTGCNLLGMETGIISKIQEQEYRIEGIHTDHSPWQTGQVFDLSQTLCEEVILKKHPVYYHDLSQTSLTNHPVYMEAGLSAYLGVELIIGGAVFGTLNFSSREIRPIEFAENEIVIAGLMASHIANYLQLFSTREELETSKKDYQNIYDTAPDMMASIDPNSGKLVRINDKMAEKLGYSKSELLGRPVMNIYTPDVLDDVKKTIASIRENGAVKDVALRVQTRTGDILDVELNATIVEDHQGNQYTSSILRDVTDRKHLERALQQRERRFGILASLSPVGIYENDEAGSCIYVNEAVSRIVGMPKDECLGDGWTTWLHPDDRQETYQKWLKAVNGTDTFYAEYRFLHPGGTIYWVLGEAKPIFNEEEKVTGYIGTIVDITQSKQTQVALEKVNKELGQLLYSVSHDLRAPVRQIEGYAEWVMVDDGPSLTANGRKQLAKVISSSRRLGEMIDALLNYSRNRNVKPKKLDIDLNEVVQEIRNAIAATDRDRKIQWQIQPLPIVTADKEMLIQVFENLMSNATKYSSKVEQPVIRIDCKESPHEYEISVADNGAGFDMAYSGKLFKIFQRLHNRSEFEGNGIGLANVHRIIESHSGRIWATGKEGVGATFTFTLPK